MESEARCKEEQKDDRKYDYNKKEERGKAQLSKVAGKNREINITMEHK